MTSTVTIDPAIPEQSTSVIVPLLSTEPTMISGPLTEYDTIFKELDDIDASAKGLAVDAPQNSSDPCAIGRYTVDSFDEGDNIQDCEIDVRTPPPLQPIAQTAPIYDDITPVHSPPPPPPVLTENADDPVVLWEQVKRMSKSE